MVDLCIIYSDDCALWFDHYVEHLKTAVHDLSVFAVDDAVLSTVNSVDEALENMVGAHALAIIASPGFLRSMVANPHVSLKGVNVKKALIFLCGIDSKDFNEVDKTGVRLADRIPEFDQWKKCTDTQWENLLTIMGDLIDTGRREQTSAASQKRKPRKPTPKPKSRKKEFQLLPSDVSCETQTMMFLSFSESISSSQSETSVEVFISDVNLSDNDEIKLLTDWINPYTFSFLAPEHTPGQVRAKILINGKSVGARHFTYQSSVLTNSVLGVTQIYVHQLCTVLDALEKLGGGGAGKDRRGSGTGARAVSAEVDNELSRIFSDCEELNIPLQAFEQMFGAYRYITADAENSSDELPNMLYVSARYGLEELASRLTDLPDAYRAYSVMNKRGLYPESVARENNHQQLAAMFENFREVGDGLQNMYVKYVNTAKGKESQDDLSDAEDEDNPKMKQQKSPEKGDSDGSDYEDIPSDYQCAQSSARNYAPGADLREDTTDPEMYLALVQENESLSYDGHKPNVKSGSTLPRQPPAIKGSVPENTRTDVPRRNLTKPAVQPPADEASSAPSQSEVSDSQRELISIMEQVKTSRLTQAEADVFFQEWKLKYETGGNCASFTQKQKQLALLRKEVAAVESQVKNPHQSKLKNKLITTLKSSFIGRGPTAAAGVPDVKHKAVSNLLPPSVGPRNVNRPGAHLPDEFAETSRCSTASSGSSSRDSALSACSRSSTMSGMMDFEDGSMLEDSGHYSHQQQKAGQYSGRDPTIKEKLAEALENAGSSVPPIPARMPPPSGYRPVRQTPVGRLAPLPEAAILSPLTILQKKVKDQGEEDTSSDSDNYLSPDPISEDIYFVVERGEDEAEEPVARNTLLPHCKQVSMPETPDIPHNFFPRKGSLPENRRENNPSFAARGKNENQELYMVMDRKPRVAPPQLPKAAKPSFAENLVNQSGGNSASSQAARHLAEVLQSRMNLGEPPSLRPTKPKPKP